MSGPRRVTLVGLIAGGHAGVPRYAASLARALDEVSGEFPGLQLSLLTTRTGARVVDPKSIDVRILQLDAKRLNRGPGRIVAEQVAVRSDPSELLHFFDLTGPILAPRRPFVATVHDLSLLQGFTRVRRAHKRWLLPWAARRALALVAISQFAKDEVVGHLDISPAKLEVIRSGPGLPPSEVPTDDLPSFPSKPYLLYVGNLTASKNLPFLVRAFDRAFVGREPPVALVLVGRPLERYGDVVRAIEAAGSQIQVRNGVTDAQLEAYYRHATALVLPSRYEGFGLTALEAMQRGRAVLASDIPAIREISGAGAHLLPLDDEQAWAEAMRRVVDDEGFRRDLETRGDEAVRRYSWAQTACELCGLFERLPRGTERGG